MKKNTWSVALVISALCVLINQVSYAQQWTGSSTLAATLYRDGDVRANGLQFGRYGAPMAGDPNPYRIMSIDDEVHELIVFGSASQAVLNMRLYDGELRIGQNQVPNSILFNNGGAYFNSNVGIGVNSPTNWFSGRLLEIKHTRPVLKLHSSGTSGLGTIQFTNDQVSATDHYGEFHANHSFDEADPTNSYLAFNSYPGGTMLSMRSNGKVGIGTTSPAYRLDVNGIVRAQDKIIIPVANATDGGSPALTVYENQDFLLDGLYINHYAFGFRTYNDGGGNGTNAYMSAYYGMDFFTNGQSRIRVNRNGNVGIGTITPGAYKLAVEGKIGAREVVVTVDPWADYVFEDDYVLPSLSWVEAYVKEHKHLPEIPSAADVKANGVALGEMNALLLKKIEELTLHLINQNKLIEEQQKSLAEQKSLLEKQNARITSLEQKEKHEN